MSNDPLPSPGLLAGLITPAAEALYDRLGVPAVVSGFGSIFVGRPMWLSTSTGVADPANGIAVAKNCGLPGTTSSGAFT